MTLPRRHLLAGAALAALQGGRSADAQAQTGHAHHGGYERLSQPGLVPRPVQADQQAVFDSPAPRADQPGRWSVRASLPLPRSEMAWAAVLRERMHLVGVGW